MIDYHCHILPGLDDGAAHIDEAIAMARGLAEGGYQKVCCTPHCMKGYYEHSPQQVREATLMLQADLDNAGIDLMLGPGMEYILDEYFADFAKELMPLGNTRLVLCEAPAEANPGLIAECLQMILDQGLVPLIAHPERTQFFYRSLVRSAGGRDRRQGRTEARGARREGRTGLGLKGLFASLASRFATAGSSSGVPDPGDIGQTDSRATLPPGCLFQANLGSFVGFYPTGTQERAYELLKAGAYHCLGSDLHNAPMTGRMLKPALEKLTSNPILNALARQAPSDLDQLADQARQASEPDLEEDQDSFDF